VSKATAWKIGRIQKISFDWINEKKTGDTSTPNAHLLRHNNGTAAQPLRTVRASTNAGHSRLATGACAT